MAARDAKLFLFLVLYHPSVRRYLAVRSDASRPHCTSIVRLTKRMLIIIFIYCNWVVSRWQWLFYMYTKYEIGYY